MNFKNNKLESCYFSSHGEKIQILKGLCTKPYEFLILYSIFESYRYLHSYDIQYTKRIM